MKLFVINLKRREDRKKFIIDLFHDKNIDYQFFEAVDGKSLKADDEILKLFSGNDFNWRRGVIGCALSHIKLWNQLYEDNEDYYCIFEDDIYLPKNYENLDISLDKCFNFLKKNKNVDLLFLGYHMFSSERKKVVSIYNNYDKQLSFEPYNSKLYIGGFFGYIITKSFVSKMKNYIEKNGVKHGIDYLIKINKELEIYECQPQIILSDWVENNNSQVDTDIQKDYVKISVDHEIVEINHIKYKYYPGLDSSGFDIRCVGKKHVNQIAQLAENEPNCHAFNSLGFLKHKIQNIEKSPYIGAHDGLYVKIKENSKLDRKIRVKMLCNWCNSNQLCKEWNHMSKGNFTWNNIQIVSNDEDVDYYVIINKPSFNEFYIPEKTIIFQMEPWCNDLSQKWGVKTWGEWAKPDPNKFLQVRSHDKYVNNAFWQLKTTYQEFKNNLITKNKNNFISSICSSKYFDPGHIKRIDFLKYVEDKNDSLVQIHIYNTDNKHNFKNYQGSHPLGNKDVGITPYKYYFMAENNSEYNFITEKIWEPLLTESLCFYWGCPNISDYIHPNAYVQLDLDNFEKSFNIIKKAVSENLWEKRIDIIRAEKQKVLEYYGFFPTLERIIKNKNSFLPKKSSNLHNQYFSKMNLERKNLKNVCFIHSCNLPNVGTERLKYILEKIKENDLFEKLDLIIINNIGIPIDDFKNDKIHVINYSTNPQLFEIPTIKLISEFSKIYSRVKLLYLHTKGITKPKSQNIRDWINYMLYFLIEKHQICLDKLDFYDAVSCNYLLKPHPHFSGNFWWANTDYIKTLDTNKLKIKHDTEWWILSRTINFSCIHHSNINHYTTSYPRIKYEI